MMPFTVNLIGPSPWGFRISGGRDFKKAITVSKVNAGSKAETASLQLGDIIMEINGLNTGEMLNVEAQNKIKSCTTLQLLVERYGSGSCNCNPFHVNCSLLQNLLEFNTSSEMSHDLHLLKLNISLFFSLQLHSWSSEEKSIQSHRLSRPLSQEISSVDFRSNSVSSRTPTPPGRYSPHSPIEREVPISPRRSSDFAMQRFDRDSEVYKMIQENKESRAAPRQSNTFKMLQEVLEADEKEAAIRFPSKLSPSPSKTTSSVSGVQKYHTCEKCGTSIVTQAVRITDDRFRHPDCYTCTECGLNLKMRGHFWVEDKMYCEKHARERYQGTGSNYRYVVSPNH
ncbi:PDZ and LIM domain protein 2-like [Sinocyclocheilus grahami]|uniref:PDZ and LIM domain protein 2-like n=1 Tax=Sinocyclocheilus grahami TaxID=75366 RepID=UPI0007AD6072|nr:PREDICTED: PDZ and LIM domain protein 2-like [Sinocyclocheilus grahami]